MADLDGVWSVQRVSGLLPPMMGVRKRISGPTGETRIGKLLGVRFVVEGLVLRYQGPLAGLVDFLQREDDGYLGRTTYRGRNVGRFRMRRIELG